MFSLSITTLAFPTPSSDSSLIARADASTSASTSTRARPYSLDDEKGECPGEMMDGTRRWIINVDQTRATQSVEQLKDGLLALLHKRYPEQGNVITGHIFERLHTIYLYTHGDVTKETLESILGL